MPVYVLKCDSCGEEYEDFRSLSDKEERGQCLNCGSGSIKRIEVMVEDCCGCSTCAPVDSEESGKGPGCGCC